VHTFFAVNLKKKNNYNGIISTEFRTRAPSCSIRTDGRTHPDGQTGITQIIVVVRKEKEVRKCTCYFLYVCSYVGSVELHNGYPLS